MAKNTKKEMENALYDLIQDDNEYTPEDCFIPWEWYDLLPSQDAEEETYGINEAYLSSKLYPKEFGGF